MSSPAQQMVFISNFGMIRVGEDFDSGAGSNCLRKLLPLLFLFLLCPQLVLASVDVPTHIWGFYRDYFSHRIQRLPTERRTIFAERQSLSTP